MNASRLIQTGLRSALTIWLGISSYLAEAKYSPLGLQASPLTEALCPLMAPASVQTSLCSAFAVKTHLLHPPLQPQARTSLPSRAHNPPTNPPNRWPPTSPKRCLLIQRLVVPCCEVPRTVDGDQSMTDESVEVDRSVGSANAAERGLQERLVRPASCPTNNASKVTVNSCWLNTCGKSCYCTVLEKLTRPRWS